MNIALFVPILISLASILIGAFLFLRPPLAIEIQKRFYEKINWRIEPISMQREILNTKFMGLFLIASAIATMIYILMRT